jgi:hypothetical protein
MSATVDDADVIVNSSQWTVDGQSIAFVGAGTSTRVTASAKRPAVSASSRRPRRHRLR